MFENPRRGKQARNFTTNVPKILDLKSSSEQMFSRKLSLGAPDVDYAFRPRVSMFVSLWEIKNYGAVYLRWTPNREVWVWPLAGVICCFLGQLTTLTTLARPQLFKWSIALSTGWISFQACVSPNCRKRFGPVAAGKVLLFTLKKEVSVVLPINIIKLSVNKTKRTGLLGSIAIFVHCFPNQSREVFRELPRRRFVRYDPRFYHLDFDLNFGPKAYRDFRERAPGPSCSKVG